MKSCPLCGAKAADTAATCFECLYSFSAMSARTSMLADAKSVASVAGGLGEAALGLAAPAPDRRRPDDPHADGLALMMSSPEGRRAVVRAKGGQIMVARRSGSGPASGPRSADVCWRTDGPSVIVEPGAHGGAVTLNGMPLLGASVVTANDVVDLGGTLMSVRG